MADTIFSALSSNYLAVGTTGYSATKYTNVDPKQYEGTWTGKFGDNKSFSVAVSDVQGFRAKVRYQSEGTVAYSQVLIKDNAFRIGDSKFVLQANGKALVAAAVTDPMTGAVSVKKAYASR